MLENASTVNAKSNAQCLAMPFLNSPIKIIYQNHGATGIHIADTLILIRCGLAMSGYRADIERTVVPGCVNIVMENFSDEFTEELLRSLKYGTRIIIIATEFLTSGTFNRFSSSGDSADNAHYGKFEYWKNRHNNFMRLAEHALAIWHLCEHQVPVFQECLPFCRVGYLPHGYVPMMRRVIMRPEADRDIDFLFTGTMTAYRHKILESLKNRGFSVVSVPASTAHFHREDLLSRTRIAMNIRQNSDWPYPSNSRFHYHLINHSYLMTERCEYSCDLDPYVVHSDNIIEDAIASHCDGNFDEHISLAVKKFENEKNMGFLMEDLLSKTIPCES